MSLRFLDRRRGAAALAMVVLLGGVLAVPARAGDRVFRVCADPNNLPFSNQAGEGFENRIAELAAKDVGASLDYVWWAQRRGFVRNTLRAGDCDAIMGVPAHYELTLNTHPYYRSTYAVVARAGGPALRSIDDPALRRLKVGVQMIGNDFSNTPPAHALANRGIVDNVVGYTVYGDYRQPNPAGRIVAAVAEGEVDVAIVWGPFAGYFAPRQNEKLTVTELVEPGDGPDLPFAFSIAMGVAKGNTALRDELDRFIERRAPEIRALLAQYRIPLVETAK